MRFLISQHAIERFRERHDDAQDLDDEEVRHVLCAELDRGTPFGAQLGVDQFLLLPCGLVAVVMTSPGAMDLKTILTKSLAIANMQAQGVVFTSPPAKQTTRSKRQSSHEATESDSVLRRLAKQHLKTGIGKKARNEALREYGLDPGGPDGARYRFLYNETRLATFAERRARYLAQLPPADEPAQPPLP